MAFKVAVLLCALAATAFAYPKGAPDSTCATLTPHHKVDAQNGVSDYELSVTPSLFGAGTTTVTLQGDIFLGFLIVARDSNDQTVNGTWSALDGNSQALSCGLTHTLNDAKMQVSGQWTAPAGFSGQIVFKAAVVQEFKVFWNNLVTDPITIG